MAIEQQPEEEPKTLDQIDILGIHDLGDELRTAVRNPDEQLREKAREDLRLMSSFLEQARKKNGDENVQIVNKFFNGEAQDKDAALDDADDLEREVLELKAPEITEQ